MKQEESTHNTKQQKADRISALALGEALKNASLTVLAVGGSVLLASYRNKNFSKYMSLSAKVSLPTMAGLGVFSYSYEIVQHNAVLYPERYGIVEFVEKGKVTSMPIHHRLLNQLYDKPFYFIMGTAIPFAGYVLAENLKVKHLTISQRVMHSRVIAQAGIIAILLSTMGFREYMDRHGRFPEPTPTTSVVNDA